MNEASQKNLGHMFQALPAGFVPPCLPTFGRTLPEACRLGLEGIDAKRRDRPYRSGRCADWVKVKNPDAPAATRVIERG
jgi:bifunctional non-homologous end joining protein LigD